MFLVQMITTSLPTLKGRGEGGGARHPVGTPGGFYNLPFQCSGSMTFWCGSGSADPCLSLMDPDSDPDPAVFVIDLQDANKNLFFKKL
jgi:hypothetical protein